MRGRNYLGTAALGCPPGAARLVLIGTTEAGMEM